MSEAFYVPLEQAKKELSRREHLKEDVLRYLSEMNVDASTVLQYGCAAFARQLVTFRFEDAVFARMASSAGFTPLWLSYNEDVFATVSSLKRSYLQPQIASGLDKCGGLITQKRRLVKIPDKWTRQPLSVVQTDSGDSLLDWHRERWERACPEGLAADVSDINQGLGGRPERYYLSFLSFFIAHMVLFEDYHGGESGGKLDTFTERVFKSSFDQVESRFGVKPLIVRMPWTKSLASHPDDGWINMWRKRPIPGL